VPETTSARLVTDAILSVTLVVASWTATARRAFGH